MDSILNRQFRQHDSTQFGTKVEFAETHQPLLFIQIPLTNHVPKLKKLGAISDSRQMTANLRWISTIFSSRIGCKWVRCRLFPCGSEIPPKKNRLPDQVAEKCSRSRAKKSLARESGIKRMLELVLLSERTNAPGQADLGS